MAFDFEDLEKNLEDEFKEFESADEEEKEEEEEEETYSEDESEEDSEESTDEDTEEEDDLGDEEISEDDLEDLKNKQISPRTPTTEERRNYAFEKLRKENKLRKEKEEELDRIAKTYGYKDNEEMLAALKEDALKKEATKKGVDPVLYAKVHETEKELDRIRKEREQEQKTMAVQAFVTKLDNFVKDNGLTAKDKDDLIVALENDGYTIEDVIKIKNPINLFKGYSVDKIKEKVKQEEIAKLEKKRKASEKRFSTTPDISDDSDIDEMIRSYFANKK